jgi:hypothetical protein
MRSFIIVGLFIAGCGSSNSTGSTSYQANACVSRDASYLVSYQETSGDCGAVASVVINVSSDGTITTSVPVSCTTVHDDGCAVQETGCTWMDNGVSFDSTSSVVFTSDGSSGTGIVGLSATDSKGSCYSSYKITYTRQ